MLREFLAVVVRAALQLALSSLLLANGANFCLIAAAASWLRLGPPCLLCARVHRLLCWPNSSSAAAASSQEHDAFRRLLCDAHVAAVAASAHPKPEQRKLQKTCSASDHVDRERKDGPEADDSDNLEGLEARRVISIGSEICEQDHGDGIEQPRATDRSNVARTSSIGNGDGDGDGPYVSLFELAPIVALPKDYSDHVQELDEMPELQRESMSCEAAETAKGDERLTVGRLVTALRAQRRELEALRAELDGERRARAEAAEYQRQLEEQGEFDREAVRLAMQLLHETETEKHGLQPQLDACRVKAQLYESSIDVTTSPPVGRPEVEQEARDGGHREASGKDDSNNYQSLVDFLPGSVYSSSPDLANLLKLYTEGNGARRPTDASAVTVVAEEEVVAVTVTAGSDSNGNGDSTTAIVGDSSQESSSNHVQLPEPVGDNLVRVDELVSTCYCVR